MSLPEGTFEAHARGRRYIVSKTTFAKGKCIKLVANARDASDYISLNLYLLNDGPRIRPCEMPMQKVLDFLETLTI